MPEQPLPNKAKPYRVIAIAVLIAVVIITALVSELVSTAPVRQVMNTFQQIVQAADAEDLDQVRRLCSKGYLANHKPKLSREGGLVGVPRKIHPNFQWWRDAAGIRICTGNREGPIYRFVEENGKWKFDGLVGVLKGREMILFTGTPIQEELDPNGLPVTIPNEKTSR